MRFTATMKENARRLRKKIVLPEGTDGRTITAARIIMDEEIAKKVFLIGDEEKIEKAAWDASVNLKCIEIINPETSPLTEIYAQEYFELRKSKGMTMEEATHGIKNNLRFGAMMVHMDHAASMVAGAENSTGKVLRTAFQIIGTTPGTKYASSSMVMEMPTHQFGKDGLMIFSDCAIIPEPDAEQLAEIAIHAGEACRKFLHTEPIVAMLTFSTKGSAQHQSIEKIHEAIKIVNKKEPGLLIDGEMQLDAAVIPEVAKRKAPGSKVAGRANTLIFPDLKSGNIGYKIAQRFGGASAYGPFLQGFNKQITDLSRGCSTEDIVITAAVTLAETKL